MSKYTKEERIERMMQLLESSGEVINEYRDLMIEGYYGQLETQTEFGAIRFVQGQIAGVRDFCTVVEL